MPFELPLPRRLRQAGWRVKIRDKENREPPHVTILRRTRAWRINLRTGQFMDRAPDPGDVPPELFEFVLDPARWRQLVAA